MYDYYIILSGETESAPVETLEAAEVIYAEEIENPWTGNTTVKLEGWKVSESCEYRTILKQQRVV